MTNSGRNIPGGVGAVAPGGPVGQVEVEDLGEIDDAVRTSIGLPGYPFASLPGPGFLLVSLRSRSGGPDEEEFPAGIAVLQEGQAGFELVDVVELDEPTGMAMTDDGMVLAGMASEGVAVLTTQDNARLGRLGTVAIDRDREPRNVRPAIALSWDQRFAIVSEEMTHQIAVIDLQAVRDGKMGPGALVARIPVDPYPTGVEPIPGTSLVCVSCQRTTEESGEATGAGRLCLVDLDLVVDGAADPVVERVLVANPVRTAISRDGRLIWVTSRSDDSVLLIERDVESGATVARARIPMHAAPVGISLISDERLAIVANSNRFAHPTEPQTLSVFDTRSLVAGRSTRIATIPAGAFPRDVRRDRGSVFVTNTNSRSLMVVDVAVIERHFELSRVGKTR